MDYTINTNNTTGNGNTVIQDSDVSGDNGFLKMLTDYINDLITLKAIQLKHPKKYKKYSQIVTIIIASKQ